MDAPPAALTGTRFARTKTERSKASVPSVGRAGMRVTLGPSLGHWGQDLQRLLGKEWVVDELISAQVSPEADGIVVLGTPELPAGQIEPGRTAGPLSLLIGTGPRASGRAGDDAIHGAVERLSAVLRALAANSPAQAPPATTRAAS